MELAKTESNS